MDILNEHRTDYVSLCIKDIKESAEAIDELERIIYVDDKGMNGGTKKYKKQAKGWINRHYKGILLNQFLYLLKRFNFTIDDLKQQNEDEEIL